MGLEDKEWHTLGVPPSSGGIGSAIWRRFPGRRGSADPLRDQVLALIGHQRADGTWPLSPKVLALLGADRSFLERRFKDALAERGVSATSDAEAAWATALACAWLELHAAALAHEWEMVADKGRRAVQRLLPPAAVRPWLEAARDALRAS